MYPWRDSYEGRDSYKDFTCIYGEIHIKGGIAMRSLHISIYPWRDS